VFVFFCVCCVVCCVLLCFVVVCCCVVYCCVVLCCVVLLCCYVVCVCVCVCVCVRACVRECVMFVLCVVCVCVVCCVLWCVECGSWLDAEHQLAQADVVQMSRIYSFYRVCCISSLSPLPRFSPRGHSRKLPQKQSRVERSGNIMFEEMSYHSLLPLQYCLERRSFNMKVFWNFGKFLEF